MRRILIWSALACLPAAPAFAQAPATPAPKPPVAEKPGTKTVEGVTVTGAGQEFRSSIDRRSYSLATDLQATTGSLSDALRNVPGVEVDVQGNVSLRGDSNVTIMIDGKPSGAFSGESRATALQQMSADRIERVEVITNPSAAFDPEGSAGVINLVTKKGRGAGRSGSVRFNHGDRGRHYGNVSGSYNSEKLALTGDLGYRSDAQKNEIVDRRTSLANGQAIDIVNLSNGAIDSTILNGRISLDYDLDKDTRVSLEARRFDADFDAEIWESYVSRNALGLLRKSDRVGGIDGANDNTEVNATYRRNFDGQDHNLTLTARNDRNENHNRRPFTYLSGPPSGGAFEEVRTRIERLRQEVKGEYKTPLPGDAKLVAGVQFQRDENDYDNLGLRGAGPALTAIDTALTNRFVYEQAISTAYATYERPFGDFTVLAGLRLEDVQVNTNQVTLGRRDSSDYFRAYPSLHLAYDLSDKQKLTASYSHRVQRPNAFDLNPFRTYQDPYTFREGNPRLKPQETHALEAGYQFRSGQTLYLATAYYRETYNSVTDVVVDLGGGTLLTTRRNLGSSRNGGLELVANGRLTPKLTYNLSGGVGWNEIDAAGLGFPQDRSGATLTARGNLNWQVTPNDFIQINAFTNGKRLTPQGYNKPHGMLNLGYRHKFDDRLTFTFTAQDVLESMKVVQVIDTPTLQARVDRNFSVRGVFVGFTYAFGAADKRKPEPAFDFGGGAPTP